MALGVRKSKIVEETGLSEEELLQRKEAEEAYRAVVDHSLQGLVIVQDFRLVFANQSFAEISGYTVEELMSLSPEKVKALVHPEYQALVWGRFRDRLEGKPSPPRYEYRGIRKDGTVRWLEMFADRIEYRGRPAVQAAIVDVTERKQAEEEIRRRSGQLATLNVVAETVSRSLDLDTILSAALDKVLEATGFEPRAGVFLLDPESQELHLKAHRGLSPEFVEREERIPMGECLCGLVAQSGEMLYSASSSQDTRHTRMREQKPHSHLIVPLKAKDKVMGVMFFYPGISYRPDPQDLQLLASISNQIGVAIENARLYEATKQELAERKRAEEALRESEERYRRLTENARDIIYRQSLPDGRYEYISPASTRLFGYPPEEFYDSPTLILEVVHPDWRGYFEENWAKLLAGHMLPFYEYQIVHKSGETRWMHQRNVLVVNDSGRPIAIEGIVTDITDRKRAEEEAQKRLGEITALHQVSEIINATLDLKEVFQRVVEELSNAFGYRLVDIYLLEEDGLRLQAQVGYDAETTIDFTPLERGVVGRVARTGQPAFIPDISQDPDYIHTYPEIASEICVPVKSGETLLGTLNVESDEKRPLTDDDLQLLVTLSSHIGVAIENARLFEVTKSQLTQLTALEETTRAVASTLELDKLLNLITQQATTLLQADGGILNLVDWEKNEDEVVVATGSAAPALGYRSPLEGSLSGWATLHNQPVISNQLENDSRVDRRWRSGEEQNQSAAIAPLTIKDQVMGTLVVMDKQGGKGEFDQADLDLLVAFANQAAMAIENARLYKQTQNRVREITALHEVAEIINATLDLKEVFQRVVEELSTTFGYRLVDIYLLEEDGLRLQAQVGYDAETTIHFTPLERGVVGRVARTGQPAFIPDISQDPDYIPTYPEIKSEICVPVKSGETLLGTLNVESDAKRPLTDDDLRLLVTLSSHIGVAIENARLYGGAEQQSIEMGRLAHDLGERVKELTCLYAVNRGMQEDLTVDELCRRVIDHLVRAMQFPEITVPVIQLDDRRFAHERYTEGMSHGLHAEIIVGGEVRGHLWVYCAEERPFLIPEEQNLLNGVAEALGLWLERKWAGEELARSFQAERERAEQIALELDLASRIQHALISSYSASIEGLEMEATWLPASEMSGDFFGLVSIDTHRLGVWMGDVSAKGVPAALIMALVDAFLGAEMTSTAAPGTLLRQLGLASHQLLTEAEQLVTLFVGVLDATDGLLTYGDAGHGQALVYRSATGETETLSALLPPLGVREEFPAVEKEIHLRPADLLVIYSDGLTEVASPDGEFLGLERLLSVVKDNGRRSPRELQEAILSAVAGFSQGAPLADDQTLVIIKRADYPSSDPLGSMVERTELPLKTWELELASSTESLQPLSEWVVSICEQVRGVDDQERFVYDWQLAASEVVTNVIKYAYEGAEGRIDLRARLFDDRLEFNIYDRGGSFDTEAVPDVNLSEPRESYYGLFLTRSVMDEVGYNRTPDGKNHWRLVKGIG